MTDTIKVAGVGVCMSSLLFGQVPAPDPLGGWGSLIIQGGCFVLVVYMVTVMYPKSAKEAKDERETRDKLFGDMVEGLNQKFDQRNKSIVEAIEKQTDSTNAAFKAGTARIEAAVSTSCRHSLPMK